MTPEEAIAAILDILKGCRGGWEDDPNLEGPPMLRGFYLCADYGNLDGQDIFFALSANAAGDPLPLWTVEGWLNYALRRELYGHGS